jgi:hypothetical protein
MPGTCFGKAIRKKIKRLLNMHLDHSQWFREETDAQVSRLAVEIMKRLLPLRQCYVQVTSRNLCTRLGKLRVYSRLSDEEDISDQGLKTGRCDVP